MSDMQLTPNKFLSTSDLSELRAKLTMASQRDRLIIELALACGARAQELLNVKATDLYADTQSVHIHGLKGSDDRTIPLPNWLFSELQTYAIEHPSERLFNIKYRRLDQMWHVYRPGEKKFHALRHTFALGLYMRSKDLTLVQTALGHRNISNTMIYLKYAYSQSEMRKWIVEEHV